jgi:hypothetical protein
VCMAGSAGVGRWGCIAEVPRGAATSICAGCGAMFVQNPRAFFAQPAATISATVRQRRSLPNWPTRCLSKVRSLVKYSLQVGHWQRPPVSLGAFTLRPPCRRPR